MLCWYMRKRRPSSKVMSWSADATPGVDRASTDEIALSGLTGTGTVPPHVVSNQFTPVT